MKKLGQRDEKLVIVVNRKEWETLTRAIAELHEGGRATLRQVGGADSEMQLEMFGEYLAGVQAIHKIFLATEFHIRAANYEMVL